MTLGYTGVFFLSLFRVFVPLTLFLILYSLFLPIDYCSKNATITLIMSDLKELETIETPTEVAEISNPDFLQEKSEQLSSLQMRLRKAEAENAPSAWEKMLPSEISELKAKLHIEAFEAELERMRSTGDYLVPELKADGTPVEKDINFLRAKSALPEEIIKEFVD